MTRRFGPAVHRRTARQPWFGNVPAVILAASLLAPVGCQTAHYSAASLPQQLRVSPAPKSNSINLAWLSTSGTSTSQIGPGDLLDVTIASGLNDEKSEPVQARVSHDGRLLVPLVGPVAVAGLEPAEAEQRVATAAVERDLYRQPYVTLSVTEQAVNRVSVLGAVAEPGVYELPRGASDLLNALAAAGGLSEKAGTKVEILHQGRAPFFAGVGKLSHPAPGEVTLASYDESPNPLDMAPPPPDNQGSATRGALPASGAQAVRIDLAQADRRDRTNYELGDRDVVMVLPAEDRFIHVTGLVTKPDQFEIPVDRDIHVLDAIAMAGGTSSPVADKVYVIRQSEGMPQPAVIQVSISKAKHNGDENLLLAPGDLVSVETTVATTVVDAVADFFHVTVGLSRNLATF